MVSTFLVEAWAALSRSKKLRIINWTYPLFFSLDISISGLKNVNNNFELVPNRIRSFSCDSKRKAEVIVNMLQTSINKRLASGSYRVRLVALFAIAMIASCSTESSVDQKKRKPPPSKLWSFGDGPVPKRCAFPYTFEKYPGYGLISYSLPVEIDSWPKEKLDDAFVDALTQCRYQFKDAYREGTLSMISMEGLPKFIAVSVQGASRKHKRFDPSGFGAIFDAKTILGSDDAIVPLVQGVKYTRDIARYEHEPKEDESYTLEKIMSLPFVEAHISQHRIK
jgi:hypothetical protein